MQSFRVTVERCKADAELPNPLLTCGLPLLRIYTCCHVLRVESEILRANSTMIEQNICFTLLPATKYLF